MFKLFTLVLMTLLLASCGGGGQGTASLSITRGFVLGNTSFSGGVYITGEKVGGGENFAAAISAGNSANVTINFGNWNIKVVGWDGGTMQTGTPYCKYVSNFAFTTAGQQLEINTTTAECFSDSNISGTNQHVTANSGPFRDLVLSTCGAHFNPSYSNLTTANGYADECVTGNYPFEYQKKYPYFKLHLENEVNTGARTAGLASTCLTAQTLTQNVKFPNRMPVTVKFYSDSACTQEVDTFRFKKGLDASLSEGRGIDKFDWSVTADSVNFFVYLPTGASKRSTTAFHTEVPLFQCQDGPKLVPCGKVPTTTAGVYYVDPDKHAVIKVPGNCAAITPSGISMTIYSCDNYKGSAYIGLKANTTSAASGTFSMNGSTYTVNVGNSGTYNQDHVRDGYKLLKRTVGFRNTSNFSNSVAEDFDEGENDQLGGLASAIYDISAMGAGGVFYDYYNDCNVGALTSETRSFTKGSDNYSVTISSITGTTPAYMARGNQPEFLTNEARFNRRLLIRKLVGPMQTTEKIIDVSCDNFDTDPVVYTSSSAQVRTGKLEEQRSYTIDSKDYKIKRIIYWNTSISNTARFDVYRNKEVFIGSTPQVKERNFYRVTKSLSDNYNHFKSHGMTYLTVRDGSSFDESITVNEVDGKESGGDMNYSHKQLMYSKIENTTIGTIFDQTFASEMYKVRYGYTPLRDEQEETKTATAPNNNFVQIRQKGSQVEMRYTIPGSIQSQTFNMQADLMASDISDDGNQKIAAFYNLNTIYVNTFIDGSYNSATITTTDTSSLSTDPRDLKVGILDDGTYIVFFLDGAASLPQVHWQVNGGTISDSGYTSYTHKSIDLTKNSNLFFLNINRTNGSYDQALDLCKVNASQTCGFNIYASRNATGQFTYSTARYFGGYIETTYIQDSTINQTRVTIGTTFSGGPQNQYPNRSFTFFQGSKYNAFNSSQALRTSAGTDVDTDYPYYNPTVPGFLIMPMYLKEAVYNSYFTSGFANITN